MDGDRGIRIRDDTKLTDIRSHRFVYRSQYIPLDDFEQPMYKLH